MAIESGCNVALVGRSQDKCDAARAKIASGVQRAAKKKFANEPEAQQSYVEQTLVKLELLTDMYEANLEEADLVVEAVVENLKVKQKLFTDLEAAVSR